MRALAVAGNVNVDLIMGPVAPWPKAGTEVFADHDELRPGGAAGNVVLAWQGLDVPFQAAGSLGHDAFGQYLRHEFGSIAEGWPVAPTRTTLSVGLTHPDGERTFFTTKGHLPSFGLDDVLSCLDAGRLRGGILLLCGAFVLPALRRRYDALFAWASGHSIDLALDTGWPPEGWSDETIAEVGSWLPHCRYLLFNEIEAAALSRQPGAEAAARALAECMHRPDGEVVVKRGPLGAIGLTGSGDLVRVPARAVRVIDTIGAGDAFNAGYLSAAASGETMKAALDRGVATASAAISTLPRRYGGLVDRTPKASP